VIELVERFARNLDAYKRPDYKETRVRVEFVDPFFEALGWDVRNVQGYAEQYKDVVHEDAVKIGGATIPADRTLYQRQIEATERKIDARVYGLTEEEIAIVEDA
jgi:hypothetical protein